MSPLITVTVFGIPLLVALFLCPVAADIERIEVDKVKIVNHDPFGPRPSQYDAKCQEAGGNSAVAIVEATIQGVKRSNCIKCNIHTHLNQPFLMYESGGKWYKVVYECEE